MTFQSAVTFSFLVLALAACTSPLERAETARAKGDWDAAASAYEEARRASSDPREIATIKGRLAEARGQAAAAHLAQADQAAMLHDRRGVVDNLTRAYELDPSDVIKERLKAAQ